MRSIVLRVLAGIAFSLVVAGAWLAYEAIEARDALASAEVQAQDLRQHVVDGDVDAARFDLAELEDSTREARQRTDGPLWYVAARTPVVGKSFAAVHDVSRVLNTIASDGLEPLVDIADQVDADVFSPREGRIDIEPVRTLAPGLLQADEALSRGWRDLRRIDTDDLLGPLQGPVREIKAKVADAHATVGAGAKAAQLIPDMLGGSGKRSYILAIQNNAEIRSTGGLPGSFAVLKARDGVMTLGGQGEASTLPYFDPPPVKPTKEELRLYSGLLTGYFGDTTFTPDFPRTAQIMRAMLREDRNLKADGVIAIDPVALSYILDATGPVKLADGTRLTSQNAVKHLLNEVYLKLPRSNEARNAYFADAMSRIFDAVSSGAGGSQALIAGLAKGVQENRILIASAKRSEQRTLESTRIAGAMPRDEGTVPHLGIFYNDATETKLEYYLRRQDTARATQCTDDGAQTIITTSVLRSVAPQNAGRLPDSIIGPETGEKRGSFRMVVAYYAPFGGLVTRLTVDGEEQPLNRAEHNGLNVVTIPVLLAPGKTVTVKASMFTGKDQRSDAVFTTTPGIEATPNNINVPSAC